MNYNFGRVITSAFAQNVSKMGIMERISQLMISS